MYEECIPYFNPFIVLLQVVMCELKQHSDPIDQAPFEFPALSAAVFAVHLSVGHLKIRSAYFPFS